MNKPAFLFEGLEGATLTASAGTDANFPLAHLQDRRYATQWKAGATTQNQTLKAQLAATRLVDTLLISNHNLPALGLTALKVESSADGSAWSQVGSFAGVTGEPLVKSQNFGATKPYWRLTFEKASALSVAPQVGMVFLGKAAVLPLYAAPYRYGLVNSTEIEESLSGLRHTAQSAAERERWIVKPARMTGAERLEYFRFIRAVAGRLHPFWFRDHDDTWHFVRCMSDESILNGLVKYGPPEMVLEEERVGIVTY